MAKPPPLVQPIRIFLSSPGDVGEERRVAREVVDLLRADPSYRGRISLDLITWDTPGGRTTMPAHLDPQDAVNLGLPRPSVCDIVVVVLWRRMGTVLNETYVKPEAFRFPTGTRWPEFRYLSGTEYEFVDAMQAHSQKGAPLVYVYRRTSDPGGTPAGLADESGDQAEQAAHLAAFLLTFRNADGTPRGSWQDYKDEKDFHSQLDRDLRDSIRRVLERRKPKWPKDRSPFPGLRAFTEEEEAVYFGREGEIEDLLRRLRGGCRFLAVVGASGSGKSSLVAAGLIPRLRNYGISDDNVASADWTIVSFRPGHQNPLLALCAALPAGFRGTSSAAALAAELAKSPQEIESVCRPSVEAGPPLAELLLVVDQFEEVFSPDVEDGLRRAFIEVLETCARCERGRLRVLGTLRADFYDRCCESQVLAKLLRDGSFPLAAPGVPALREMIERPAAMAGLTILPDLVNRIANDAGSARGNLPLMAYTLEELRKAPGGRISSKAYEELGGIKGAIGTRAEEVFRLVCDALKPAAHGEPEREEAITQQEESKLQEALQRILVRLVQIDGDGALTRRRAARSDFAEDAAAELLIQTFSDPTVRLFMPGEPVSDRSGGQDAATFEVAHEALLQKDTWGRVGKWIDENAHDWQLVAQLSQAAKEWRANARASSYLWHAERLERVRTALARWPHLDAQLGDAERAFLNPREEARALLRELELLHTTHRRRREIGERLCEIGDDREGVGLRKDGLPALAWCAVEGSERVDIGDRHHFAVDPFHIARHPVTCEQFLAFASHAGSLENESWWRDLRRATTLAKSRPPSYPERAGGYPQTQVTWCEAVAFCRWLTENLPADAWPEGTDRASGWVIRLPTEWEWQLAPTGGEPTRLHPWGEAWDSRRANTAESGLGGAIAVGLYPDGNARCGASDMVGNVEEWCLNDYGDVANTREVYDEKKQQCALRGGSYGSRSDQATCLSRAGKPPQNGKPSRGFRVACVRRPGA